MTTIAWDGRTLAADCQSTVGNARFRVSKLGKFRRPMPAAIYEQPDDSEGWWLFAYSGDADMGEQMVSWFTAGADPKEFPEQQRDGTKFSPLLVVSRDGLLVYECTPYPIRHRLGDLFAMGSGMHYALSAMHCGRTAAEAVEVASVFDPGTGMGVETLVLP